MTALMIDPTDHWLDLDVQAPRRPLRNECFDAFNVAADAADGMTRAYWTGVGTGYAVGFGWLTREALDRARRTPAARLLNPLEDVVNLPDEEDAWACGVLYGYQQGTSEVESASECTHCAQRLTDDDESERCEHGKFCPDCADIWHRNIRDICTYVDAA